MKSNKEQRKAAKGNEEQQKAKKGIWAGKTKTGNKKPQRATKGKKSPNGNQALLPRTISSAKLSGFRTSLSGLPFVYQNTSALSCYMTPGLPYVKDRLLSCATKSLDRIAQNPLVEESISRNRLNPAWDCFPTPLSLVHPGQSSV